MRISSSFARGRRRAALVAAIAIASPIALVPYPVSAEGLFDLFFGGSQRQQQAAPPSQANFFADPNNNAQQPPQSRAGGSGPAFCVRSCDGKYFPLMRAAASPVQVCQSFCPASATKVYYGSNIDSATTVSGERYPDSANAFAYRKALRADCTCNGRDPAGLAPVDLTLDSSLRPGDMVATTNGLVAYSAVRAGTDQTAEFTPVASYPGLTAEARARLGEMKVAPVAAEIATNELTTSSIKPVSPPAAAPKPAARDKRAAVY